MTEPFLPYGVQSIDAADVEAVATALRDPYLTTGPRVEAFEADFARACDVPHAIACANGTAALHLAALALGIQTGDVVLVPTMSFLASANGMRFAGAETVFIDCDPKTGLVTPETFAAAIERAPKAPKAAVVVHLNGNVCDMEAIAAIAEPHGIALVEDACHALGGERQDSDGTSWAVGSCRHSVMAVFSLHPVKTITMGEGGVVTTRDEMVARRLRALRSHGMTREPTEMANPDMAFDSAGEFNPWYYEMPELGYNYRVTDFQCAMGRTQLARLPEFAMKRRELKRHYDALFASAGNLLEPVATPERVDPVLHLYAIRARFGRNGLPERGPAMRALKERGIGTMVHYIPIHRQPYYAQLLGSADLPGADAYYADILSIPFYPDLGEADVRRVAEALIDVLSGR